MLPNVITSLIEAWVSTQRIQKYLLSPELDPAAVQHSLENKISTAISIEDGRFSWDANADFTVLKDVNFNVRLRSPTLAPSRLNITLFLKKIVEYIDTPWKSRCCCGWSGQRQNCMFAIFPF